MDVAVLEPAYGILHFSTVLDGPAFMRLARRIESRGIQVVFDLEDTHWDPDDPLRTRVRKSAARAALLRLAAARKDDGMPPLTVRVNGPTSEEWSEDVALLGELSRAGSLSCVVLPKVERAEAVTALLEESIRESTSLPEVIPLIETGRGVSNLTRILKDLRMRHEGEVRRVMYGGFDHCLDTGRWPFWEQDTLEFWEFVRGFVSAVEAEGFEYVHTPIDALGDTQLFRQVLGMIGSICQRRFFVTTLVEMQITAALQPSGGTPPLAPRSAAGGVDASARARQVVSAFERGRRREHGFAIDPSKGRFISPHEVLAARRFLEARRDADC
jgi:citrate lyase beta subunit